MELAGEITTAGLPWKAWWARVLKTKATDQWIGKLKAKGVDANVVEGKSREDLGDILFMHMDADGCMHSESLQLAPA